MRLPVLSLKCAEDLLAGQWSSIPRPASTTEPPMLSAETAPLVTFVKALSLMIEPDGQLSCPITCSHENRSLTPRKFCCASATQAGGQVHRVLRAVDLKIDPVAGLAEHAREEVVVGIRAADHRGLLLLVRSKIVVSESSARRDHQKRQEHHTSVRLIESSRSSGNRKLFELCRTIRRSG